MPVKREPAEPQGFIKLTGVGIPAFQDGEEVKSDEYSQPTLELSRTFEGWWLPERPLCCDDPFVAVSGA